MPHLRHFAQFAGAQCTILGAAFVIRPEWYESGAYAWAADVLPLRAYATLWLALAVGFAVALRRNVPARFTASLFGVYSFTLLMFAWSIFQLTWNGAGGASVGALQWSGYVWLAWRALFTRDA